MSQIQIDGLYETMAMLRDAPKTVVATGFTRALSAAGNVIAEELEIKAPIKKEELGGILDRGELRESVMVSVSLDQQFRGGTASVGFMTANGADSVALWLEYGHRIVVPGGFYYDNAGRKRKGSHVGDVPPHPFVTAAADAAGEAAIDAFTTSLAQTVRDNFPQGQLSIAS